MHINVSWIYINCAFKSAEQYFASVLITKHILNKYTRVSTQQTNKYRNDVHLFITRVLLGMARYIVTTYSLDKVLVG